jgi:hypothetical protein
MRFPASAFLGFALLLFCSTPQGARSQTIAPQPLGARYDGEPISVWRGNDGATYYMRQAGNEIWWVGLSSDDGQSFTNVFRGTWAADGTYIRGKWADVPRGRSLGSGELTLVVETLRGQPVRMFKRRESGTHFSGSEWTLIP